MVVGIRDSRLAEKLQLDSELTLSKAVTQVRQAEAVKEQQHLVRGENHSMGWKKPETPVGAVLDSGSSPSAKTKQTPRSGHKPGGKNSATTKCGRCGKSPFHDHQQCPARDAVCHNCAKRGHFKSVCRSAKVSEICVDNPKEEDAFLGGIQKEGDQSNGRP